MTQDKQFLLYVAKSKLHARMMRGVKTQFENANMLEWTARIGSCRTLTAVEKLRTEFERADQSAQ